MGEERHTGENIAAKIETALTTNGLALDKLAAMVRDDARNMQRTGRILESER